MKETNGDLGGNGNGNGHVNEENDGYDSVLTLIVDYAYDFKIVNAAAWERAKATLLDALGAAFESIHTSAECLQLIGPTFPGSAVVPGGFRLPGTMFQLDILKGAFDLGSMIRYLDHNDAFPGAEWGHPSDNLGAILATADIFTRAALARGDASSVLTMEHVLIALMKAYEIQGCFQIKNAFNKVGLDHVILVKVASTAMVAWLIGLSKLQAKAAVSHAWMDGHPLRVYRQAPNAGPRKGWAGGDAGMRAVHLALLVKNGQPGAKSVLSTSRWGFYDVLYKGGSFDLPRPFGSWVIENVLFKVNTAEGHGMTAVEAALDLSKELRRRGLSPEKDIAHIRVRTQEAAMIIIDKQGPLRNAADRDHCLKYMVAVVLLKGSQIDTEDYQDDRPWASDPRVEALRQKTTMVEDATFTKDYHDQGSRSLSNALLVTLQDGTQLPEVVVKYPQGHVRRGETLELVQAKAKANLALKLSPKRVDDIMDMVHGPNFLSTPASHFIDMFSP